MPTGITKIYENSNLTVEARIDKREVASIEEITFKFLTDGEQFEEQTIPMSHAKTVGDHAIVRHVVKAPPVADGKGCYFLDYHYFYRVKNRDASTDVLQDFPASRIQVFPRFAQLKVTDKDGNAFPGFQFAVEQNGERGEVRKTFASDTRNAKGETIPAGSCEFNLGLFQGFRVIPMPPYDVTEEVVSTGRKREIKGTVNFRAAFVAPEKGTRRQFVNEEIRDLGRGGEGHEVTIQVGIDPEDLDAVRDKDAAEVHFRVTFGPPATDAFPKSARNDTKHPTKAMKASDSDTATIEEKDAGKKYEGKATAKSGKFKVALGKAGGDTCRIEISGSPRFLTETSRSPDATLTIENWRRVHYELMLPDIMVGRATPVLEQVRRRLEGLGRQIFVEFNESAVHPFDAIKKADLGTLAPQRFLGGKGRDGEIVYILSGRNWRRLPQGLAWAEEHPGKTLRVIACDAILKFRSDTDDEQKGTSDISGTLKQATGSINVEEQLGGLFMPFSGYDGGDGLSELEWTADISKDDEVCKYTAKLEIVEGRKTADSAGTNVLVLSDSLDIREATATFTGPELSAGGVQAIQGFVDDLLARPEALLRVNAKVVVRIVAPADTGHDEDKRVAAVKGKLQELFDGSEKKEFAWHPALDEKLEPRTGVCALQDITVGPSCTVTEWHFRLPNETPNGDPGPGSFVGKEKTRDRCPVKVFFSAQAHELSQGEIEGNLIAWICDASTGSRQFLRLVLQGLQAVTDEACLDHGHGAEGFPGDCLEEKSSLCAECVKHARSRDLTSI